MLSEARTVELGKLQGHGIPELERVGCTRDGLFVLLTVFGDLPTDVKLSNNAPAMPVSAVLCVRAKHSSVNPTRNI